MVSKTFDEGFLKVLGQEYPLPKDLPEGWPVYTLLNFADKNTLKGRLTTQKILCNLLFEKNVLLPYTFKKDKFGPFDPKIPKTIEKLGEEGKVKETKKEGYTDENEGPDTYPLHLTTDGLKTYQSEIRPILEKNKYFVDSFKSIVQLNTLPSMKLAGFCYDRLYLFNEIDQTETKTTWESRRQGWIQQINSELSKNKTKWTTCEIASEEFKFYFLTSIDYFEKILANRTLLKMDQVQSGIVLYNISRFNKLVSKLFDFAKTDRTGQEPEKTFIDISRLFYFVNEYSERVGLFPSVFNEDADILEFMSEGDRTRVMAALRGS